MINVSGNHWIPSAGYKYISNGTAWSEEIFLGLTDNISNWYDTNEEPPEPDEPASESDYAEAAKILLGVSE